MVIKVSNLIGSNSVTTMIYNQQTLAIDLLNDWVAMTTVYLEAWQMAVVLAVGSIFLLFIHR
jgi:hypothetical protein